MEKLTKLKNGQKLTKLKIGQNRQNKGKLDKVNKIENWTKLINGQN